MTETSLRISITEQVDHGRLSGVPIEAVAVVRASKKIAIIDVPDDGPRRPNLPQPAGAPYQVVARTLQQFEELVVEHAAETKTGTSSGTATTDFRWDPAVEPAFKAALDDIAQRLPGAQPLVTFHVGIGAPFGTGRMLTLSQPIPVGGDRLAGVPVSLAATSVGHVTATTAQLCFRRTLETTQTLTATLAINYRGIPLRGRRATAVTFSSGPHPTAMVEVRGLAAATQYDYHLVFSGLAGERWSAGHGTFRTTDPNAASLRLAFASCTNPTSPADAERWTKLNEWAPDALLLVGDQIYGDYTPPPVSLAAAATAIAAGIPASNAPPGIGWSAYYDNVYRYHWSVPQVRDALRRQPTYMLIDDHEVADDWGTTFDRNSTNGKGSQVAAALGAFEACQQPHNPPTPPRPPGSAYDFSFARGQVAFFAFDVRSQRNLDSAHPVLGVDQMARFDAWCASTEVASADVIVAISPVPFAFCDVGLATRIYKTIAAARAALNFLGGGGSLWSVMDDAIGWSPMDLLPDVKTNRGRIVEPDLADQWANSAFQPELGHILGRLFDLQNDPARQRVVVALSGDSHIGGFHTITSPRPSDQKNDVIYQVIASPIGTSPNAALSDALNNADDFLGSFALAPAGPGPFDWFNGRVKVMRGARNFGTLSITRASQGRSYDIRISLHVQETDQIPASELRTDLHVDLDTPARPMPLFPSVQVTTVR